MTSKKANLEDVFIELTEDTAADSAVVENEMEDEEVDGK